MRLFLSFPQALQGHYAPHQHIYYHQFFLLSSFSQATKLRNIWLHGETNPNILGKLRWESAHCTKHKTSHSQAALGKLEERRLGLLSGPRVSMSIFFMLLSVLIYKYTLTTTSSKKWFATNKGTLIPYDNPHSLDIIFWQLPKGS